MKVSTTPTAPTAARGEVLLTVAGQQHSVKFNLNVLRDWSKLTGKSPSDFGPMLSGDYTEALTALLTCAVRRFVPAEVYPNGFSQDDAGDLMQDMSQAEAEAIAEAITESMIVVNPLLAALNKQVAATSLALPQSVPNENGTNTSTLPSAS